MISTRDTFEIDTGQSTSTTERQVAALWQEVLQAADLPNSGDNFFALGGDSMAMVMLEFRIKEELSVELPPGAVLGTQTLRELSSFIDAARTSSCASDTPLVDTHASSGGQIATQAKR